MNLEELIEKATRIQTRYDALRIRGEGWSGNARQGFEYNPREIEPEKARAFTPGGGLPTPTGGCCREDVCTVETQESCESDGGEYQGDGTDCEPNPCVVTGGCCRDGTCTTETRTECESDGGLYQGDGIECADPNPCFLGGCCQTVPGGGGPPDISCRNFVTPFECTGFGQCPPGYQCTYTGDGHNNCVYPTTCDPGGGCCIDGHCQELTYSACLEAGGGWYGNLDDCDILGEPCDIVMIMQLGDMASSVFTPIAGALGLDCYDPETGDLKPESNCAQRRQRWNEWGSELYDELFEPKKGD